MAEQRAWHEARARDAEQAGDAFAAMWHLDRLIAMAPDDWFLFARRARLHADAGRFDRAAAELDEARRFGRRDDVLAWETQCAARCRTLRRWQTAMWYLERLIAAQPDDGGFRWDRLQVAEAMGVLEQLLDRDFPADPFAR